MPDRIPTFEESIMPRSTIKACAKTVLHQETAIQKDALTALAKGSSVFISYLTTNANEIAMSKKRKTIMPSDVFEALKIIEFERFIPDLKEEYERAEVEAKEKRERKKSAVLEESVHTTETDTLPNPKRPRVDEREEERHEGDVVMATEETDADKASGRAADEDEPDADDNDNDDDTEEEDDDDEDEEEQDEDVVGEDEDEDAKGDASVDEKRLREQTAALDALGNIDDDGVRDDYDEALDDGNDSD